MDIALAVFTIVMGLTSTRSIAQEDCPERDPSLTCERSCTPETGCRKAGRQCECAGDCGWSCIRQGCSTLSAPENGGVTIDPDDISIGSTATYTCNDGYILQGTSVRTCQENKTWSEGDEVSCECIRNNDEVNRLGRACARPCPDDGICLRARYLCICDDICEKSCIPLDACYNPPDVENGRHNGTKEYYLEGELLFYTCDGGYYRRGSLSPLLRCQQTGDILDWGNFDTTCLPKSCGHPGNIANGSIEGTVYSFRSSVTYVCDIGYRIQGLDTRHCQADQQWSGSPPQCNLSGENLTLDIASRLTVRNKVRLIATWSMTDNLPCETVDKVFTVTQKDRDGCKTSADLLERPQSIRIDSLNGTKVIKTKYPNSLYEVTLDVICGTKTIYRKSVEIRTVETAPAASPTNIIYKLKGETLKFEWMKPPCGKRNGNITGYEYVFEKNGQKELPADRTRNNFKVYFNLKPGDLWTFKVRGETALGRGPYTGTISYHVID